MMKKNTNNVSSSSSPASLTKGLKSSQLFYACLMGIILYSFLNYENIHDKLAWYRIYHRTTWNQIIHFFGVPGLLWTSFLYGIHIPIPAMSSNINIKFMPLIPNHHISFAFCGFLIYVTSYLILDPVGGMLYFPFLYFLYASVVILYKQDQQKARQVTMKAKKKDDDKNISSSSSSYYYDGVDVVVPWYGTSQMLKIAFWIHIFCWYVQIHPGHAIFEGAKPALLDSLGDALTAAPLFAYHELLWYLGFRQELLQITVELVDKYTQQLCDAGSTMRVCSSM